MADHGPHHITLTDECLRDFDSNYKMSPPLRTRDDIQALIGGKWRTVKVTFKDQHETAWPPGATAVSAGSVYLIHGNALGSTAAGTTLEYYLERPIVNGFDDRAVMKTSVIDADSRPQLIMMRAIQRRAPTRSRIRLLGTSNRQ